MSRLASLATVVVALAAALAFHDDDVAMAVPLATVASDSLQKAVDGAARPTAIFVTGRGVSTAYGAASGEADVGTALTVDTPLRLASNTKTFVAATALRLWENGRLDLDAPIDGLLSAPLTRLLEADGYDTRRITVRQLLTHSAGLYDHAGDPRFIQTSIAQPDRRWTREGLVRLATEYGDPRSAPGTEFRYSDTGYILLGDIIERVTGRDIAAAVRAELGFDRLGLKSTWWEVMEVPPSGAAPRARQWLGDVDATDIHASMDLYGGGGLVMSVRDLATFAAALFEGRVFERPDTLKEMFWKGPHQGADQYRMGVFVKRVGSQEFYSHSGFWGTLVYYAPSTGVAVAGATTHQGEFGRMRALVERAVGAASSADSI
ncbi:D-alanyl-D-alanine carboxypeptidase precursor [compost metagenome]